MVTTNNNTTKTTAKDEADRLKKLFENIQQQRYQTTNDDAEKRERERQRRIRSQETEKLKRSVEKIKTEEKQTELKNKISEIEKSIEDLHKKQATTNRVSDEEFSKLDRELLKKLYDAQIKFREFEEKLEKELDDRDRELQKAIDSSSKVVNFIDKEEYKNEVRSNRFTLWYCVILAGLIVFKPANQGFRYLTTLAGVNQTSVIEENQPQRQGRAFIDRFSPDPDFNRLVVPGERIAGFEVTSTFGMRVHPVTGEHRMHEGIDLATPLGTPLKAIGERGDRISIECFEDSGYGIGADMKTTAFPGVVFRSTHLSECDDGNYKPGQVFAKTGNTGMSTAPHLHFEVIVNGKPEHPKAGFVWWLMLGEKFEPIRLRPED